MTVSDLRQRAVDVVKGVPKWKLAIIALLVLFAASYLIWSFVRTPSPKAGAIIHLAPAVTAPKVEGPLMKVPLRVVPKPAVIKRFPQLGPIPAKDEVINTGHVPPAENGGSTVTTIDTDTGEATTDFIPAEAPWFAFEAKNEASLGVESGNMGTRAVIGYRRDLARIKDVHLVVEGAVKVPIEPGVRFEYVGSVKAAYRW